MQSSIMLSCIIMRFVGEVFGPAGGIELTQTYTAWGGVPRYWELAADLEGPLRSRIDALVLDPSVRFTASRTVC
jgi:hypothetical protein